MISALFALIRSPGHIYVLITNVNNTYVCTHLFKIYLKYKNKNKNKNKFISEQKMKFDDNEILLINILLETHTMGTTAIT